MLTVNEQDLFCEKELFFTPLIVELPYYFSPANLPMLKNLISLLLFVPISFSALGQIIYLSNGVLENGKHTPISNHSINLENYSGFHKVIFNTTDISISKPILLVSKKNDSLFQPIKWVKLVKRYNSEFFSADIEWGEDGEYKLSVIEAQKEIISDYYSLNVNEEDALSISEGQYDDEEKYNDPNNTFYYIDSKVEFCEFVNGNSEPVNFNSEFPVGNVSIHVTNYKPIISDELKIYIYRLKGKKDQELIDKKYFPITSGSLSESFTYYFGTKGSFVVSIYANEDVWVNDGNIKIK